jgi:hypothetical protein
MSFKDTCSSQIPSSYIDNQDEVAPFITEFPRHLLSESAAEEIATLKLQMTNEYIHILNWNATLHLNTFGRRMQPSPILGKDSNRIEAHDLSGLEEDNSTEDESGRTSAELSTISGEHLFGNPLSSRRPSSATTMSTQGNNNDSLPNTLACEDSKAEQSDDLETIELFHEFEHYCELMEVGDPANGRDRNFTAPLPTTEATLELTVENTDAQVPVSEANEYKASQATEQCPPQESDLEDEHPQPEVSTISDLKAAPTPAEAVALAHSHCEEVTGRIRILEDVDGGDYVLYLDCYHCVPIELAPDILALLEKEEGGHRSAAVTADKAIEEAKLVATPEDENED